MLGLRPSDTSSSWCRWWLGWRRHARVDKPFCAKSLDLQFQSFTIVLLTTYLYWIKGILRGYAIRSGRRPEGSQRPQGGPQVRPGSIPILWHTYILFFCVHGVLRLGQAEGSLVGTCGESNSLALNQTGTSAESLLCQLRKLKDVLELKASFSNRLYLKLYI